jgi:hypothetical protein
MMDTLQRRLGWFNAKHVAVLACVLTVVGVARLKASTAANVTATLTIDACTYVTPLTASSVSLGQSGSPPVTMSVVLPSSISPSLMSNTGLLLNQSAIEPLGLPTLVSGSGGTTTYTLSFAEGDVLNITGSNPGSPYLTLAIPMVTGHWVSGVGPITISQ